MTFKTCLILCPAIFIACNNPVTSSPFSSATLQPDENLYRQVDSIPLPEGYERIAVKKGSFAAYLRGIALKKDKTVFLYNGSPKQNQLAQYAVLDISVGDKDLQQCADAVMRLRAEYLFSAGLYDDIHFSDNAGKTYRFTSPYTRANLQRYLQQVFGMCGSASLEKQLKPGTAWENIQPGDVLIRGGFPGHATIVMDVAQNDAGERLYMLAQSYMPAQNIHILLNPATDTPTPWYSLPEGNQVYTPEYTFYRNELRSW